MKAFKLFILMLIFMLSTIWGCRQDNAIEGFDLLSNPNNLGKVDSTAIFASFEKTNKDTLVATGGSSFLELGQYDNLQSTILLKFKDIPDSVTIEKAKLLLVTNTIFTKGNSKSAFNATIHEVLEDWNETDVTSAKFGYNVAANSLAETTIFSTGAIANENDSLFNETVTFTFNEQGNQLIHSWSDTLNNNFGILVNFENAEFIKEFFSKNSSVNQPKLELEIITNAAVRDTLIKVASADAYLVTTTSELPTGPLYVDNIFSNQTVLKFDLSNIPRESVVNHAVLKIGVVEDLTKVKSSSLTDGFVLRIDRLAESFTDIESMKIDSTFFPLSSFITPGMSIFSLTVTSLIQFWVTEDVENHGILLRASTPGRDISRVAFQSNTTSVNNSAKIELEFSTAPESVRN